MHETEDDLQALRDLLDRSKANAGAHLRSIFTPITEMTPEEIADEMVGVQVLNVATVTRRGEPRVAPVDGLFYRARFYFGTAAQAVRARHIRERPQVSAAHTRGEDLAILVHGRAVTVDIAAPKSSGFRAYLNELYPGWDSWYPDVLPPTWYIEPKAMFAARVSRLREQ